MGKGQVVSTRIFAYSVIAGLMVTPALAQDASVVEPVLDESTTLDSTASEPSIQTVPSSIRRFLAAKQSQRFTLPGHMRKHVGAFYAVRDFEPIWVLNEGLNERARKVLAQLSEADKDGLRPLDYLPASLNGFTDDGAALGNDPVSLARLEIEVTRAALMYARHATAGRLIPKRVDSNMSVKPKAVDPSLALENLSDSDTPGDYLAGLFPKLAEYAKFRSALSKYRSLAKHMTSEPIPGGRVIRPGEDDPRIEAIRRRLIELGSYQLDVSEDTHLDSEQSEDVPVRTSEAILTSITYDGSLANAVRSFQKKRGLSVDGIIGGSTINALNGTYESQIRTLTANMERMRWLPDNLGSRYIIVNQAAYELRLMDNDSITHKARVIVGKPKHQTPVISNSMSYIVFNPYWNVPRSIATKEMLPKLVTDPSYLARQGYEVFYNGGGTREQIYSEDVYWDEVEKETFNFHFRQPPGPRNALGRLKFMFPNRHNIYLHDTPTKSLFKRSARAFSHGCVRLHNPQRLAEILLRSDKGWSAGRIKRMINTGVNQRINLKRKVPIHLTYFTAWTDGNGELTFKRDMYRRDARLIQALDDVQIAMN